MMAMVYKKNLKLNKNNNHAFYYQASCDILEMKLAKKTEKNIREKEGEKDDKKN
jgi:hypothetical protein